MIKVFGEHAKQIEERDLFVASRGSSEGRDVVTLDKVKKTTPNMKFLSKLDEIIYILRKEDIPQKLVEQIYTLVWYEMVEAKCKKVDLKA